MLANVLQDRKGQGHVGAGGQRTHSNCGSKDSPKAGTYVTKAKVWAQSVLLNPMVNPGFGRRRDSEGGDSEIVAPGGDKGRFGPTDGALGALEVVYTLGEVRRFGEERKVEARGLEKGTSAKRKEERRQGEGRGRTGDRAGRPKKVSSCLEAPLENSGEPVKREEGQGSRPASGGGGTTSHTVQNASRMAPLSNETV